MDDFGRDRRDNRENVGRSDNKKRDRSSLEDPSEEFRDRDRERPSQYDRDRGDRDGTRHRSYGRDDGNVYRDGGRRRSGSFGDRGDRRRRTSFERRGRGDGDSAPPVFTPNVDGPVVATESRFRQQQEGSGNAVANASVKELYHEHLREFMGRVTQDFFEKQKHFEWLSELLNPYFHKVDEAKASSAATAEALLLSDAFMGDTVEAVKACRLDRSVLRLDPSEDPLANYAGRHCNGHQVNTVLVTDIPASVSRAYIVNSLTQRITAKRGNKPVRVIPGRQVLRQKRTPYELTRCAWVVLDNHGDAREAVQIIEGEPFTIPSSEGKASAESSPTKKVKVTASLHRPHESKRLPRGYSNIWRMQFDLRRCKRLALLLDAERGVPSLASLSAVLTAVEAYQQKQVSAENSEGVSSATQSSQQRLVDMSDQLDVAVAYLRRVHWVAYFQSSAHDCESELLRRESGIAVREGELHYATPEPVVGVELSTKVGEEEMNEEASEKGEEEDAEENGDEGDEDEIPAVDAAPITEVTSETDAAASSADQGEETIEGPPADFDSMTDEEYHAWLRQRKLGFGALSFWSFGMQCKLELRAKIRAAPDQAENILANVESKALANKMRIYAKKLLDQAAAEAATKVKETEWLTENSRFKGDGKARCVRCDKLFMDREYLMKHFTLKHADEMLAMQVNAAESFMKEALGSFPLGFLPLPRIGLEGGDGKVERVTTVGALISNMINASDATLVDDNNDDTEGGGENDGGSSTQQRQTNGKRVAVPVDPDAVIDREVRTGNYFDVDAPKVNNSICSLLLSPKSSLVHLLRQCVLL